MKSKKGEDTKHDLITFLDHTVTGILVATGFPPRIVFVNETLTKMLGYTKKEFLSLSPLQIMHLVYKDDRKSFFERYKKRISGKKNEPFFEFRGVHKNRKIIWLNYRAQHIQYEGHSAIQASFTDVTGKYEIRCRQYLERR